MIILGFLNDQCWKRISIIIFTSTTGIPLILVSNNTLYLLENSRDHFQNGKKIIWCETCPLQCTVWFLQAPLAYLSQQIWTLKQIKDKYISVLFRCVNYSDF